MSLKDALKKLLFVLPLSVGALGGSTAQAQAPFPSCGPAGCAVSAGGPAMTGHCANKCCPGPYIHCTPQMPKLKYKPTCGKPICEPCDYEGYGYYPTCWRPWTVPVNYVCPVPSPTQLVHPAPELLGNEHLLPAPTPLRQPQR